MTDEEYIFRQTEMERKRNGRGDFNKKRQGGRHVRLPSDNLTAKEKRKMNGEMKSYNLSRPMDWREYKTMPEDLRREYVTGLQQKYGASNGMLSEMFKVTYQTIWREMGRLGLKIDGQQPPQDRTAWEEFLAPPAQKEEIPPETHEEPRDEPKLIPDEITRGNAEETIGAFLRALKGTGAQITITFTL